MLSTAMLSEINLEIRDLEALNSKFGGLASSGKWTLCIGAGVCRGIVPTWQELRRRLVNETFEGSVTEDDFEKLVAKNGWSLDSWIQACANHYALTGRGNDEFFDLIEKHLYSDLRARARASNLETVLVTVLDKPKNASREDVARIHDFFEKEYKTASLVVALSNDSRRHDLATKTDIPIVAPRHLWLSTIPGPDMKTLYKEAMVHLGVRPAWIDGWDHLGPALANLIALRTGVSEGSLA
jgi:hypothetical protein